MKSVADKQFLQDSVQSIYMLANLKSANTNIAMYEDDKELYQEIQFIYIKTKDRGDSTKIYMQNKGARFGRPTFLFFIK